jgi:hypothetical protein
LKVRDVAKLNKAINDVFFRDLRLFENVAKFDRFVKEEGRHEGVVGRVNRRNEGEKNGGLKEGKKSRELKGVEGAREGNRKLDLEKVKEAAIRSEEERERELVVKVGEIVCPGKKERVGSKV